MSPSSRILRFSALGASAKVDILAVGNTVGERSRFAVCDLRSVIVVPRDLGVAGFLPRRQSSPLEPRVLCLDEALTFPLPDDDMAGCRLREKRRQLPMR